MIERGGEMLFERRPATGVWAGCGAFPKPRSRTTCGISSARASAPIAMPRRGIAPIEHGFTHFTLTMHPQRLAVSGWPHRAEAPERSGSRAADALAAALPAPIKRLLRSLA